MSQPDLADLWRQLSPTRGKKKPHGLDLRLAVSNGGVRLFAARERRTADIGLVLECPVALVPHRLASSRLRRIEVEVGTVDGMLADRSAVIIVLRDQEFTDLFADMSRDLCRAVEVGGGDSSAINGFVTTLQRWRHFLDEERAPLNDLSVRGLIGELVVLEQLVPAVGTELALSSWVNSVRDFELPDRTIEAKTFSASSGGKIRISDHMQLITDPGVPLYLACQELGRSTDPDNNLPGHVARVRTCFESEPGMAARFDALLETRHYSAADAPKYTDGFALGSFHCFAVREGFPYLPPESIPTGVQDINFSLTLADLAPFAVELKTMFMRI